MLEDGAKEARLINTIHSIERLVVLKLVPDGLNHPRVNDR